jgi:hypothetical protein
MNREPEPGAPDPVDVESFARELLAALADALPRWTLRCLRGCDPSVPDDVAFTTVEAVLAGALAPLEALLLADIDDQRGSPLSLVREAVRIPTAVLRARGVAPVARDAFRVERFPDDVYDLSPATWADIGGAVAEPGLRWGAAKAFEHRRRHR